MAVEYGEELIQTQSEFAAQKVGEDIQARVKYFTWEAYPNMLQDCLEDLVTVVRCVGLELYE
jgi:hypothetical protein